MSTRPMEALSAALEAIRRDATGGIATSALQEIAQALTDLVALEEQRQKTNFVMTSKRQPDGSLTMFVTRQPSLTRNVFENFGKGGAA